VSLEPIKSHCRTLLAGYKIPRQLHVVETIQRSPSGKPDYPWALRTATTATAPTTAPS
jgi:acyl-CoA synthetase (AMP-forming)/AMP-acid ligase II